MLLPLTVYISYRACKMLYPQICLILWDSIPLPDDQAYLFRIIIIKIKIARHWEVWKYNTVKDETP
jgi:hypothetical protein